MWLLTALEVQVNIGIKWDASFRKSLKFAGRLIYASQHILELLGARRATAFAADAPALGLKIVDAVIRRYPYGLVAPVLGFGLWAASAS